MTQARPFGVLLLLMGVLGYLAVASSPPLTHAAGMWPVGLASGLFLVVQRRRLRWAVASVAVLAFGTIHLAGYSGLVAAGYALGIVLEGLVTRHLLWVPHGGRRRLDDDRDLGHYTLAGLAGAATGAVLFATTAWTNDYGTPWMILLAVFASHLASQLILLAFFLESSHHRGVGSSTERVVRWTLTVTVTLLAFVPIHLPALTFFVLPLLGWTALRAPMREALWLLVTVGVVANTLVALRGGPFLALEVVRSRPPELAVIPQQMFLLGCAMVCLPFAMAVRRQRHSAIQAANERERLRRIVRGAAAMAIIETDDQGRITLFNPGAEAMLGYTEAEVVGRRPEVFCAGLAVTRADNEPRDWTCVRKDGEVRTMSMSVGPINDHQGHVVAYLITAEDITERVRTNQALETALGAERRAVAHLTEIDRTKDAFVSSVSHELRTPITNIVGYLELLREGAYGVPTDPQEEALGRISSNSYRLLELIDDLLTLSSVESLEVELVQEPVDLRDVIRRSGARVQPDLTQRSLHLDVELPSEPVVVLGDEAHLERMVSNLTTNAVKFTPDGGTIVLRVRSGDDRCSIEVQDTGVGIPPEEQALLFNRFFRSTYAQTEAVKGSGLGLSIARSIAQRHGARISARSTPGHGSLFTVTFTDPRRRLVPTPRSGS